jgi:signal peptidase I
VRRLLIGLAMVLGLVLIVGFVGLRPYQIPTSAMEPTLDCAKGPVSPGCLGGSNDRVLACRICLDLGSPSRGDIIGLPGETVHEDDHGSIWIKKAGSTTFTKLDEPYLSAQLRLADSVHFGRAWRVPDGQYFVLGDNRSQSCDSRTWGSVPRHDMIGTVVFRYWPLSRLGFP